MEQNIEILFFSIYKRLQKELVSWKKSSLSDTLLRFIYQHFGQHLKFGLNYNVLAKPFNKNYYWENLLKNLLFFNYLDNINFSFGNKIVDIGCGAAPASTALSSLFKYKGKKTFEVHLLDKSSSQLNIAKNFLSCLNIKPKQITTKAFHFETIEGLSIFSYFICEQKRSFIASLFKNRQFFRGGFVIIDYKDNIDYIEDFFHKRGDDKLKKCELHYCIPKNIKKIICEYEVNIYGCYYRPQ